VKEDRSGADNVSVASGEQPSSAGAATPPQAQALQESVNQMEIRALQRELATMRVKWSDLERDHGNIQEQVKFSENEVVSCHFRINCSLVN
jgi:hypothetical protein